MKSWHHLIGEVARGKEHAGDLAYAHAFALFQAWLRGEIPELEQGALWSAYRIKGETPEELSAFVAATEAGMSRFDAPPAGCPIVFGAYNGARREANLLPLLALALAQLGVPVLVHGGFGGIAQDPDRALTDHSPAGRIPSGLILDNLGHAPARDITTVIHRLARQRFAYVPIDVLHPGLARLLALRARLGVRSSPHTMVKLLQPFATPAVVCAGVTHPPYLQRLMDFHVRHPERRALLLRGTEGEPVANPKRRPALIGCDNGVCATLLDKDTQPLAQLPILPADKDIPGTCRFIESVLAGKLPLPAPLADQAACLLQLSGRSPDLATARAALSKAFALDIESIRPPDTQGVSA